MAIYEKVLLLVKLAFLHLSQMAKNFDNNYIHKDALSDILYFYAFTHIYFTSNDHKQNQSSSIIIRECEISNVEKYASSKGLKLKKINFLCIFININKIVKADSHHVKEDSKVYKPQFIWGQMVGWFKQTVSNPEASLSQDRRGTLSYPSFDGSFKKIHKKNKENDGYPFQKSLKVIFYKKRKKKYLFKKILKKTARIDFLNHLVDKPSFCWPPKDVTWSYRNNQKFFYLFYL